jgi:hypothetical protein
MRLYLAMAALLAVSLGTSTLEAQVKKVATPHVATMDGVTDHPVSQEELARAILSGEDGDQSVLNTRASYLVAAMNEVHPFLRLENRQDLARLVRQADVGLCSSGYLTAGSKPRLSRVRKSNGTFDIRGWEREFHEGEQCLFDPTTGAALLSLGCGNPIPNVSRRPLGPAKPENPLWYAKTDTVYRDREVVKYVFTPSSSQVIKKEGRPWWQYAAGLAVLGGAGYVGYRCITDWCRIVNENTNINNNPQLSIPLPLFH